MPTFLADTFAGGADNDPILGRTPDTTFSAQTWSGGAQLTGTGAAKPPDASGVGSSGSATIGDNVTNYSLPTTVVGTFFFRTGPSVAAGVTHFGFNSTIYVGGRYIQLGLKTTGTDGVWYLRAYNAAVPATSLVVLPGVTADTVYQLDISISDGVQSITCNGVTSTINVAYTLPSVGVNYVTLEIGGTTKLESVSLSDVLPIPPETVTADLTAPMGVLDTISLWSTHLTAPFGILLSQSHDATGEREFRGVAPMGALSARTGANANLSAPMGTLVSSVTVPVSVRASLASPFGELSSSATVAVTVRADLRMSSAGTLTAYAGAVAALSAPPGVLNAVATAGVMAYFADGAPMGVLSAAMSSGIVVRAELVAPMMTPTPSMRAELVAPMGRLNAVARAVVTITYEAYAVNLQPGNRAGKHEVTHYTNWPFDGIVRHGSRYYAWGPSGLFLLGGTTDDGDADISWSWKTAITDFKSPMGKNVPAGIIRGRIGPSVTASVSVGERADKTYAAQIIRGQNAQNHRVKFGRGTDDTYYSFGLAGTGQGDVTELALDVIEHKRRI